MYPPTVACDESASIAWARVIRGTDSSANAVTPAAASASTPAWSESGSRKPISTWPEWRRPRSSADGLRTLTTPFGLPRVTDRRARLDVRVVRERRGVAGAPLDDELEPLRRELPDGLRHERDPPLALRRLARNADPHPPRSLRTVDALLHQPWSAAALRGRHARVVRGPAAGRDGADRLRRARVAGPLLDRHGDRGGRSGRDRRRQPRLLADRPGRRPASSSSAGDRCAAAPNASCPQTEELMAKHGGKVVFFGRFVTILRYTAAWVAGIAGMQWRKFLFWNAAGGICWATLVGLVAYYAGGAAADAIQRYGIYAAVVIAGARPDLLASSRTSARSGWKTGCSPAARARARARGRRLRLRRRFGGRDHSDHGSAVGAPARLHARRPRRVREPRGDLDRRQPRRPDVQRARAPLRDADELRRRRPSEPAELPRARVRLDARDLERLHRLRRRALAASPTRSRPPGRPGRRTPRIFRTRASPAARPAATRRSTTRSSTSATSPARVPAATASFPSRGSHATSPRAGCPTSRSSSRTSATTCTTAPSRRATPG